MRPARAAGRSSRPAGAYPSTQPPEPPQRAVLRPRALSDATAEALRRISPDGIDGRSPTDGLSYVEMA